MAFYIHTKAGKREIDGAIFDMDGTLLYSMHIWDDIGSKFLKSIGIHPEQDLREVLRVMSVQQGAEYFIEHYGVKMTVPEIVDAMKNVVARQYEELVEEKPGIKNMLETLKNKGVKMCVATATDKSLSEIALKRNGLLDYFSGIITCGDVGKGKDEPYIYQKARELIGTETERTAVFEDAYYAAKTAKDAGFILVGVEDKSAEGQRIEIMEISDAYTKDFKNLI